MARILPLTEPMPGDVKAQNDRLRTFVLRNRQTLGKLHEAMKNLDQSSRKKIPGNFCHPGTENRFAGKETNV